MADTNIGIELADGGVLAVEIASGELELVYERGALSLRLELVPAEASWLREHLVSSKVAAPLSLGIGGTLETIPKTRKTSFLLVYGCPDGLEVSVPLERDECLWLSDVLEEHGS